MLYEVELKDQIQSDAVSDLLAERRRQDKKWGEQNHDPVTYLAIVQEELGEATKEALALRFRGCTCTEGTGACTGACGDRYNDRVRARLRTELVQVAASTVAAIEALDRMKWKWTP